MSAGIRRRLSNIERSQMTPRKRVVLWDDGSGKAEIEAAAIDRESGGKVEVVIVSWLPATER
jgi:hypothetical protein